MRAKKRGDKIKRMSCFQRGNRVKHLDLVRSVESIAGFYFRGRRAVREHRIKPPARLGTSSSSDARVCADRAHNSAAGFLKVEVRRAAQTQIKFVRAIAGENDVGVRVNETGQYDLAARVDLARVRIRQREQVERVARRDDLFTTDGHRAVVDDRELALGRAASRRITSQRENLIRRVDEKVNNHCIIGI